MKYGIEIINRLWETVQARLDLIPESELFLGKPVCPNDHTTMYDKSLYGNSLKSYSDYLEEQFHYSLSRNRELQLDSITKGSLNQNIDDILAIKTPTTPQSIHYIKSNYIIPFEECINTSSRSTDEANYVNCTLDSINSIARQICNRSRELTSESDNLLSTPSVFFLLGEAGAGKTSLLNYIMVNYSRLFLENKAIFIRLNFNDIDAVNYSVSDAFYDKFIPALSGYLSAYLSDDNLSGFLADLAKNLSLRLFDKIYLIPSLQIEDISACVNTFIDYIASGIRGDLGSQRYTGDAYLKPLLISEMIRLLQSKQGYSFVFALDGLDELQIDYKLGESYRSFWEELKNLIVPCMEKPKAVWIIPARPNSSLYSMARNSFEYRSSSVFTMLKVYPPNVDQVIRNRILSNYTNSEKKYSKIDLEEVNQLISLLVDVTYRMFFGGTDDSSLSNKTQNKSTRVLSVFNGNIRHFLRLLNQVFQQINLSEHPDWRKWRPNNISVWKILNSLVDSRTANGYRKYFFSPDGNIQIDSSKIAIFPNLFDYYIAKDASNSFQSYALCKIRILQYLEQQNTINNSANRAIDYLHELFNYEKPMIRRELDYLIMTGQIEPDSEEEDFLKNRGTESDVSIRLTKCGSFLFNQLIARALYYESTYGDTPISSTIADRFPPVSRLDQKLLSIEYILKSIRNTIAFVQYLKIVEDKEIDSQGHKSLTDKMQRQLQNFRFFTNDKINGFQMEMARSIDGYVRKFHKINNNQDFDEQIDKFLLELI